MLKARNLREIRRGPTGSSIWTGSSISDIIEEWEWEGDHFATPRWRKK
jgi:hypothetical protein